MKLRANFERRPVAAPAPAPAADTVQPQRDATATRAARNLASPTTSAGWSNAD
ncbi:MAG: hypothetical protein U1F36_11225 [Planctomycetota bacterium]